MNSHVKNVSGAPADLSRRSFLVGSAATGLALGYSAVPTRKERRLRSDVSGVMVFTCLFMWASVRCRRRMRCASRWRRA